MFNSQISRTIAAVACTVVFSATCVLGAVAPAQAGFASGVTAPLSAARVTA